MATIIAAVNPGKLLQPLTRDKITEQEPEIQPPSKRSARIKSLELQQKKIISGQMEELKAAKLKAEQLVKQAKLQSRQRSRELKRTIRSVVLETLESFKAQVNRQLKNVRGAVGKNKKCITADLEARLNNVSDDVREHLEEQLGARVQALAEKWST